MSCERTRRTDWALYFADTSGEEWAELREHIPGCPDCSREAARFLEMRAALREGIESAHPEPEELLAFDRSPVDLSSARHAQIERHVAGCVRCRNELSVLEAMVPATVGRVSTTGEPERAGLFGAIASFFSSLSAPAVGAAVAALIAVIFVLTLQLRGPGGSTDDGSGTRIAHDGDTGPPSDARPEPLLSPESLLAEALPEGTTPEAPEPAPQVAPGTTAPRDVQLAEGPEEGQAAAPLATDLPEPQLAEGSPVPEAPAPEAAPDASVEAVRERLLASLTLPTGAPHYDPTAQLSGAGLDATRIDVVIRGSASDDAEIRVLAPEHRAITFESSPLLYWYLSKDADIAVEVLVVDVETDEPVFEERLAPPVHGGLHALDLAAEGVRLEADRPYSFFATLVPDPNRRDLDRTSGTTLESRPEAAPKPGKREQRIHDLAAAGSWIDAFATLQGLIEEAPDLPRAAEYRKALLEQAGRPEVAAALGAAGS